MVNIEVDSEKIKELYERIDDLRDENKKLKATVKAYAKQVNRLEQIKDLTWASQKTDSTYCTKWKWRIKI